MPKSADKSPKFIRLVKKRYFKILKNIGAVFLKGSDFEIVNKKRLIDYCLYEFSSYEDYSNAQIEHNIRKINKIFADESTLDAMCRYLLEALPAKPLKGLCHGTRNGFEQNYIAKRPEFDAIGTDISPTATEFERSVVWDFHDVNDEWTNSFDFVYSNSLDQSWQPHNALATWLNQIKRDGFVIIEHTRDQSPMTASKMDPFGVRPNVMPYVLTMWFGHQISVDFITGQKSNMDEQYWLYIIRKNVDQVTVK